jgi:hypothetical protein
MKLYSFILTLLLVNCVTAQNSYLYVAGEKILIRDGDSFAAYNGKITYSRQKDNGEGSSDKYASIKKIDSIVVEGKVRYYPVQLIGSKELVLYKTLITAPEKKVLIAFFKAGKDLDQTMIRYSIVDNNNSIIEKGTFKAYREYDKQSAFFRLVEKHFPGCSEVAQSIKKYEAMPPDYERFGHIEASMGFSFQKQVFVCN